MKKYLIIFISINFLFSAKLENMEVILFQPDGDLIECFASGDEYYNWIHDNDGYTIIQSPIDGYYYYAIIENNQIVPSAHLVNSINPLSISLTKGVKINASQYYERKDNYWEDVEMRDAPSIGTLNNINIFIRFFDEVEFPETRTFYDIPFNLEDGPSMVHYFKEVSYDLLTVNTTHFPTTSTNENISYQDQYTRGYYQPYNEVANPIGYQNDNQSRTREHELLKNAVEAVQHQIQEDLDVDANNDGYVDNVTFLVRGSPGAWASLLWPHRWALYTEEAYINGSRVYDYNLNLEQGGYFTVGTLCHEFSHSLGAPDLYHYWDDVAPVAVGGWDVMDASADIPQYMSAYMKYRYTDWITELPVISYGGTYQLYPLSSPTNNIFRINSPSSSNEYFVVEYRVNEGIYDINTPGDQNGLLIYRVNSSISGNGNGPPDELYVYRTNGTLESNGSFAGAVFSELTGKTKFNDNTNPSCFLYDGTSGGINITNIGYPGEFIQFDLINMILLPEITSLSYDSDNDGILNPNEEIHLDLQIANLSDLNAENVIAYISSPNQNVNIINNELYFQNINSDEQNVNTFITMTNDAFGQVELIIDITSNYQENGQSLNYDDSFVLSMDVSLNQKGFPYSTLNEIHSSPIVSDLDLNGEKEIIFGDHFGVIKSINQQGEEVLPNVFPFATDGQIWGAPAMEDIDLDGYQDIIISSKDNFVYAFDMNGLKWSFNANTQLIGSPAIANINESDEKEIIISGYSNNTDNFYVLNHLGQEIDLVQLDEKNKAGFAIADFNNNNLDDVVFGTDENKVYLMYEGEEIAEGFPFIGNDKFRIAPVILKTPNNLLILAASKNKTLYAINEDGTEHFSVEFTDYISSSISILNDSGNVMIFIGLNNGDIYGLNHNGQIVFTSNINSKVIGTVIFSDMNYDDTPEIIAVNNQGELYVINLDGSHYEYFPIDYAFPYSSTPIIEDLDNDNDLEIIGGTTNSLIAIDIKENGSNHQFWNMYGANKQRTNFYEVESICLNGDLDNSSSFDVSDIVLMVNCVLMQSCGECSDMNNDGLENVLDIIQLVNIVLGID